MSSRRRGPDAHAPWCVRSLTLMMKVAERTTGRGEFHMHAVIGRVRIKPDRAEEALAMIGEGGVAMLRGMPGSTGGYWARATDDRDVVQHSFWLFDTEDNARGAEATFNMLRDMPEAPATFISVDVCEVIGQA